jgi:hypothetical protein
MQDETGDFCEAVVVAEDTENNPLHSPREIILLSFLGLRCGVVEMLHGSGVEVEY